MNKVTDNLKSVLLGLQEEQAGSAMQGSNTVRSRGRRKVDKAWARSLTVVSPEKMKAMKPQ